GLAGAKLQRAGHVARSAQAPALEDAAVHDHCLAGLVGAQAKEAELRPRLLVRGHEGAPALAAHDQVLGREFVDGLANGALADAEAGRELRLARDEFARLPLAALQAAGDEALDLAIERTEGGALAFHALSPARCVHAPIAPQERIDFNN